MPDHPLAEVFGFPTGNMSPEAEHYRQNRLCPFNNRVPSCTKASITEPLGVCSVNEGKDLTITCPIRFRQNWTVAKDAAHFFFPPGTRWTALTEVRLYDKDGQSAGNIDIVLAALDREGRITDFGALEVQAVYISGNVRRPFEYYMQDPPNRYNMHWRREKNYPRPDYLSSSRKRLAPQLVYKGGILRSWQKKQAVALHTNFYNTLPDLPQAPIHEAEIAWLLYDLVHDEETNRYNLVHTRTIYTRFLDALEKITLPQAGPIESFMTQLQRRLADNAKGDDNPAAEPPLRAVVDIEPQE